MVREHNRGITRGRRRILRVLFRAPPCRGPRRPVLHRMARLLPRVRQAQPARRRRDPPDRSREALNQDRRVEARLLHPRARSPLPEMHPAQMSETRNPLRTARTRNRAHRGRRIRPTATLPAQIRRITRIHPLRIKIRRTQIHRIRTRRIRRPRIRIHPRRLHPTRTLPIPPQNRKVRPLLLEEPHLLRSAEGGIAFPMLPRPHILLSAQAGSFGRGSPSFAVADWLSSPVPFSS